jgi:hypothetical protein
MKPAVEFRICLFYSLTMGNEGCCEDKPAGDVVLNTKETIKFPLPKYAEWPMKFAGGAGAKDLPRSA